MPDRKHYLRVATKAVIVEKERLLCTRNIHPGDGDVWYCLPGGGQQPGETLEEALLRECQEEIGAAVEIGQIVFARDYIGENHEFAAFEPDVHQVEIMFQCRLAEGERPGRGLAPDSHQTGFEWLDLDRLDDYRFYPAALKDALASLASGGSIGPGARYLGDVN